MNAVSEKTVLSLAGEKGRHQDGTCSWLWRNGCMKKRLHLAGLGDVGRTTLISLALLGGEVIEKIGIYDLNELQMRRLEMELNQICDPFEGRRIPGVYGIPREEMFDCDVFVFCVSGRVPGVGMEPEDVRMAQYEVNRKIISWYVRAAESTGYQGLFLIMSDPVEPLCRAALRISRQGRGILKPGQIQGCGLGVMHGRAVYYARREDGFRDYLEEGRVFGSHGKDLVAANSIRSGNYDEERSLLLTDRVIHANMDVRKAGYKPYIAPAVSSGAFTILRILRGEWNYSSNYLGGVYFGGKNRTVETGIEWEAQPLPGKLYKRLERAYHNLEDIL